MASVVDPISRSTSLDTRAGYVSCRSTHHRPTGRYHFEGADHGDVAMSMVVVSNLTERVGPDAHAHPFAEVFVVHEEEATSLSTARRSSPRTGRSSVPRLERRTSSRIPARAARLTAIHPSFDLWSASLEIDQEPPSVCQGGGSTTATPSVMWICHPSSCTVRWCVRHSKTRLSNAVGPPSRQ